MIRLLSVKYILVECSNFVVFCAKYFTVSSVRELIEVVDSDTVIDFIKHTIFIAISNVISILYWLYSLSFALHFYHLLVII